MILEDKIARGLYIGVSKLPNAGIGIFTSRFIRKGDPVCEYKGDIKPTGRDTTFVDTTYYLSSGDCIIDPNPQTCKSKIGFGTWVNDRFNKENRKDFLQYHFRQREEEMGKAGYNCRFWIRPDGKKALLISIRNIEPDEELYVDYGDGYWQMRDGVHEKDNNDINASNDKGDENLK